MITIFNRAELLVTYDLNTLSQYRDALDGEGIGYTYRFKDRTSPAVVGGGSRTRAGNFGIQQNAQVEYKLYVRKDDLERAVALFR